MNVTGITDPSVLDIYGLYGTDATNATSNTDSATAISATAAPPSGADSANFSKLSEFFSKLQQLNTSDPEEFKQICTDIADKLTAAAQEHGGGPAGKMQSDLAAKFQNVANGGDISQLQPAQRPGTADGTQNAVQQYKQQDQSSLGDSTKIHAGHHHHGGHHGGQSGIQQLMSSIFDEVNQATASSTPAQS